MYIRDLWKYGFTGFKISITIISITRIVFSILVHLMLKKTALCLVSNLYLLLQLVLVVFVVHE